MLTTRFNHISYYYTLEYYFYEQNLDYTLLDYLDNNNIELGKLVCFFDVIKNGIRYIITTDEKKSHQLITISECDHINNLISDNLVVYYNGCKVTISENMNLQNIENLIGVTENDIKYYATYYANNWDSVNTINDALNYISELNKIYGTIYLNNLRLLSILTNCTKASIYNIITKAEILKFNIGKLFPNLTRLSTYYDDVLYQKIEN
jgi:hypothetical protein